MITDRDKKIFDFLFRVKYATVDQILKYMEMTKRATYVRLAILVRRGYIESHAVLGTNMKLYANGHMVRIDHVIDSYKRAVTIQLMELEHHLKVTDVFMDFLDKGIKADDIYTEREIMANKIGIDTKKKRLCKVPDLAIKRADGKLIAIEVELSRKNNERLESVMKNYDMNTNYYAVRYLCINGAVKRKVERAVESTHLTYVIVYTLDEFTIDLL